MKLILARHTVKVVFWHPPCYWDEHLSEPAAGLGDGCQLLYHEEDAVRLEEGEQEICEAPASPLLLELPDIAEFATNWFIVAAGETGDRTFVHPSTIVRTGNMVKVWTRWFFSGGESQSAKLLKLFDCERGRGLLLQGMIYNRDGRVISLGLGEWESVVPDSMEYFAMLRACQKDEF